MINNTLNELKREAAKAAIKYVVPGAVLGVGTGSTANHFIDALASLKDKIPAAVASSQATAERLKSVGIAVVDLEEAREIPVYVDGADEIDGNLVMIKGGGGALTREKIVAYAASRFICIADESKKVVCLGAFPLPLEVIALARGPISRALTAMGGKVTTRKGFITDNGNLILDVHGLNMDRPVELEEELNQLPGLVAHGLFARRRADVLLLASASGGVKTITQNEPS